MLAAGVRLSRGCLPGALGRGFSGLPEAEVRALQEAGRRIFDTLPLSPDRTGNKVLRKKWLGPIVTAQDIKPFEHVIRRSFPTLGTEEEEHRRQKLAYMRRRGKGPPKKGSGKRSGKKK